MYKDKDKDKDLFIGPQELLWDILRLPSSRRAALGLYVILMLWRGRGVNQPPYTLLHRSSLLYALRHGRRLQDPVYEMDLAIIQQEYSVTSSVVQKL